MKDNCKKILLAFFGLLFSYVGCLLLVWIPTQSEIGYPIETLKELKNLAGLIGIYFADYLFLELGLSGLNKEKKK